ncbi:MAG: thymidine phosphorylase [Thermotogaceae bacterium]|nr:thymidine phosphorylase [Thermotogaceae bacterium]
MIPYEVILKKRNGGKLNREEIEFMVMGYVRGEIPDYQMAAFLMAVYFRHMDKEERAILTEVMAKSGDMIDLSKIGERIVDKHSSGGVGDKTTLVVAPLVASVGVPIAKMSGRALGHTGGTIDKLESIPGFKTSLSLEEFISNVKKYGIAIAGQTANLAPADKKIYALRDATATVDEISLIASSIMSKKLAGGANAFVLDVKAGSGAFMKTIEEAKKLAEAMVGIGKAHGKDTVALITNMEEPLGIYVGNSLEVLEAIEFLKGNYDEKFFELCIEISSYMVRLSGKMSEKEAKNALLENLKNGKGLEKFRDLIKAQGGDERVIDSPQKYLPISQETLEIKSEKTGYVKDIDTEKIGIASILLGAGRINKEDTIDPSVGIKVMKKIGDKVEKGESLATIFISKKSRVSEAIKTIKEAYTIAEEPAKKLPMIYEVIS